VAEVKAANLHTSPSREVEIGHLKATWREHADMCFYPQSGRVSLRGLGIALRSPEIEHLPNL
jgi:hypothetical protein